MSMEEEVISIIKQNTEREMDIKVSSDLKHDLDIDSFEMLMITNEVEEKYGIQIDETDLESIRTVQDIVDRLNTKIGA